MASSPSWAANRVQLRDLRLNRSHSRVLIRTRDCHHPSAPLGSDMSRVRSQHAPLVGRTPAFLCPMHAPLSRAILRGNCIVWGLGAGGSAMLPRVYVWGWGRDE